MHPKKGGQLVRSAGASAQLVAKEGDFVTLRLPSGEEMLMQLIFLLEKLAVHVGLVAVQRFVVV
ncbi:unnamed protein product [Bathycoccus prasinos]